MPISLEDLFTGKQSKYDLSAKLDLSQVELRSVRPFTFVDVSLELEARKSFVMFSADVSYDFTHPCDRCADEFVRHIECEFKHKIVNKLTKESDEYILAKDCSISLEDIITEDILLSLPSKILCGEECKGLCSVCGTNLNKQNCTCTASQA